MLHIWGIINKEYVSVNTEVCVLWKKTQKYINFLTTCMGFSTVQASFFLLQEKHWKNDNNEIIFIVTILMEHSVRVTKMKCM
jgi:hypothetical protein